MSRTLALLSPRLLFVLPELEHSLTRFTEVIFIKLAGLCLFYCTVSCCLLALAFKYFQESKASKK